nr:hypothetical protein [Tanacetum cinerariifolium]
MVWEDKKAKTKLNIKEGNFNKLDDLVGEGADYAVNKMRSNDKIRVLNAEAEGVSAAGETLSTTTLAVSTVSVQLSSIKDKILAAPGKASKVENAIAEMLHGLDQLIERKEDKGDVRTLIMDEAHASGYLVYPGVDKTSMTLEIFDRLTKSAYFLAIREDYKIEKLARIYIDKIVAGNGVPVSIISYHDGRFTLRVLANITESLRDAIRYDWDVHLPLAEFSYKNIYHSSIRCAPFKALYGKKCRSPVLWAEIGESWLIEPELVQETTDKVVLIKEKLKAARDRQKSYADNRRNPLEFEVEDQVVGHVAYRIRLLEELSCMHDTFYVSNLNKCLADANLHVPLDEINIDKTLRFVEEPIEIMDREARFMSLDDSFRLELLCCYFYPWMGVIHFRMNGKLAPRYVGPFEILERVGHVAYRIRLLEELSCMHDTFYVSNLNKCLADANLHVPLDEINIDKTLRFVEEPIEIMDREVKRLKRSKI